MSRDHRPAGQVQLVRTVHLDAAHRPRLRPPHGDDIAPAGRARASREYRGTEEVFDLALPAVISVKEGINLPRYPSLPGRLRAKRAVIERFQPEYRGEGLRKELLRVPAGQSKRAEILGTGADAVPALVRLFEEFGVLS